MKSFGSGFMKSMVSTNLHILSHNFIVKSTKSSQKISSKKQYFTGHLKNRNQSSEKILKSLKN